MGKRTLAGLLAAAMLAAVAPVTAFAAGADTGKAIQLVDESNPTGGISGWDSTAGYDFIYFGDFSGPIKWRVLDTKTNMENAKVGDGLFLLSDVLLGRGSTGFVYFDDSGNQSNAWQGSTAQKWCEGRYILDFSEGEQGAVLATTKSDGAFTSSTYEVTFAASENILNGARVFFLSAEEAENSAYGFTDDNARMALYGNADGMWWLRSPVADNPSDAGRVTGDGAVEGRNVDSNLAGRPAFNLDLNSVLFTSAAEGGKAGDAIFEIDDYDGNEWKLTLLDRSREFAVTEETASGKPGGTITLNYTGATTGTNEYISVIIADNSGAQYYGRVAQPDNASGQIQIEIPASLADGTYTLIVFSEQYNGGANDDTKLTDYASAFEKVTLTVSSDATAPALTAGDATRESKTNATVKFTSNEAGSYYYEVVESGAGEPTIDTSGAGTACDTNEQTISLTSLSAGAKDIYIVVKDAAGNVSEPLKIEIPASKLAAPQNLTLTGDAPGQGTANWENVENASAYSVQLYKDSAPLGEAVTVQGTSHTFAVTEAGGYTFTVTAHNADGLYLDSEPSEPGEPLTFWQVAFAEGGIPAQYIAQGGHVQAPADPAKEGYTFGGWYADTALTERWDFDADTVTDNVTLYAKWTTEPAAGGDKGQSGNGDQGAPQAPAATPAPQDDTGYYTCPACGAHDWTATDAGYRCDACGYVESGKQLAGYGNVKGLYDPAAAPGSAADYDGPIPQTGDESRPLLWALLLVFSGSAMGGLTIWKKKKN